MIPSRLARPGAEWTQAPATPRSFQHPSTVTASIAPAVSPSSAIALPRYWRRHLLPQGEKARSRLRLRQPSTFAIGSAADAKSPFSPCGRRWLGAASAARGAETDEGCWPNAVDCRKWREGPRMSSGRLARPASSRAQASATAAFRPTPLNRHRQYRAGRQPLFRNRSAAILAAPPSPTRGEGKVASSPSPTLQRSRLAARPMQSLAFSPCGRRWLGAASAARGAETDEGCWPNAGDCRKWREGSRMVRVGWLARRRAGASLLLGRVPSNTPHPSPPVSRRPPAALPQPLCRDTGGATFSHKGRRQGGALRSLLT